MEIKLKYKLLVIICLIVTNISAQKQNVKFERANFPDQENALQDVLSSIAKGEEYLFRAEAMMTEKGIDVPSEIMIQNMITNGLTHFLQANEFNPQSAQLNFTIGKSYFYLNDYANAMSYLKRAQLLDDQNVGDIEFFLGRIQQILGNLYEAVEFYNIAAKRYSADPVMTKTITSRIKQCRYADDLMNDALDIQVENFGVMNTSMYEYSPIITNNGTVLFFERFLSGQNKIYLSEQGEDGEWETPVPTGQILDLSDKGLLTQQTLVDKNGRSIARQWFVNNNGLYDGLAALSPDKMTAYFSSNRYNNRGDFDIYMSQYNDKKGQWDPPQNIPELNTDDDEFGVALHPNGSTLFFSSNGHQTIGGYDIFKSEIKGKYWDTPENVGYPINSTVDDIVYSIDGNQLYFSSNREGGIGKHDIYTVNFVPGSVPVKTPLSASANTDVKYPAALYGFVSDKQTNTPISVKLRLLDKSNNTEEVIDTDDKGLFYATLSAGGIYRITINAAGYKVYTEDFKVKNEIGQQLSKYINLVASKEADTQGDLIAEGIDIPEEEIYEGANSVVVLSSMIDERRPEISQKETTQKELPVNVSGVVTDNQTFSPLSVALKVKVKGTNDENTFYSDSKGRFDFNLASGNVYNITIERPGYRRYTEELALSEEFIQDVLKNIILQAGEDTFIPEPKPVIPVAEVIPEPDEIPQLEELAPSQESHTLVELAEEVTPLEKVTPVLVEEVMPETFEPIELHPLTEEEQPVVAVVEEVEPVVEEVTPVVEEIEPVVEEVTPVVEEVTPVVEEVKPVVEEVKPAIIEKKEPQKLEQVILTGTVLDSKNKKTITESVITLTDITRNIVETIPVNHQAKFSITALAGSDYSLKVIANGYRLYVKDLVTLPSDKKIEIPVELESVVNSLIANIYFDFDRAALNDEAKQALQKLISIIKQENQDIFIVAYTDNSGGRGYNERLSKRRAETLGVYLISNGIDKNKINISWGGLTNPVETNATIEGRKLNNRVEIWVQ